MATTLFKGGLLPFQHNRHKRGVGKVIHLGYSTMLLWIYENMKAYIRILCKAFVYDQLLSISLDYMHIYAHI